MSTIAGTHDDRPVRIDEVEGRQVVVKRYLATDGARIWADHRALWRSPFGAGRPVPGLPQPLAWDAHARELRMSVVPGHAVGARGDVGRAPELAGDCARLLADLHASGVSCSRRRDAARVVRSLERKLADLEIGPGADAVRDAVELLSDGAVLHRVGAAERLVVSHGDWSPRNVLVDDDGDVRLIDLDRIQMAGAAHDVAYWGAWMWATQLIAGAHPSWDACHAFLGAYLEWRPETAREIAETYWFHRAAALVRIAHGWTALGRAPQLQLAVAREAVRWAAQA